MYHIGKVGEDVRAWDSTRWANSPVIAQSRSCINNRDHEKNACHANAHAAFDDWRDP
jgi:hypothetical protein